MWSRRWMPLPTNSVLLPSPVHSPNLRSELITSLSLCSTFVHMSTTLTYLRKYQTHLPYSKTIFKNSWYLCREFFFRYGSNTLYQNPLLQHPKIFPVRYLDLMCGLDFFKFPCFWHLKLRLLCISYCWYATKVCCHRFDQMVLSNTWIC